MISRERVLFIAAVALSLSIGWGIRGNFGHENGAMIPGALAALAALAVSHRPDWSSRLGSFAFFGALGWSFGGSISYMQVIAYTHSGDSLSVFYGFGCLFLIGFLWALFGGVGTALPAFLSRKQLDSLYPVIFLVFCGWLLQDYFVARFVHVDPDYRQRDPLYWYDTDWVGISVALVLTLLYGLIRRRFEFGEKLIFSLCLGWWAGFAFFVLLLGWRMTPPRGDNWSGCLGMAIGLTIFLRRAGLSRLLYAGAIAGIWGGFGFAFADFLKLLGINTGWSTNWHSVLEQTYGLVNGLGIAVMMLFIQRAAPPIHAEDVQDRSRFFERAGIFFVLVGVTYLNLQKNVETWVKAGTVPQELYGVPARTWFNSAYAWCGLVIASILFRKQKGGIALLSGSMRGRAQFLCLVFLWWVVIGNFERALVGFAPQRLVTEGVIQFNALLCTALLLSNSASEEARTSKSALLSPRRLALGGMIALFSATVLPWLVIRGLDGNRQIGYASRHVRFGALATATGERPSADKPHP